MEERFTFDSGLFNRIMSRLLLVFLVFYPLRHVHMGIDWWDTGYNYSNFINMGLEHMDSMWLFSTYLATAVGHILTLLPQGGTLVGLNIYTGLFVSAMAVISYLFCTKILRINYLYAFWGEFIAVSLCWCPTSLLYNYLTYFNLVVVIILLYRGLTRQADWMLVVAGIFLGLNIFVRFSNIPEAMLILAVWAYGVGEAVSKTAEKPFAVTVRRTLLCLAGYLGILVLGFLYIHLRYGITEYVDGIGRLFAMTEHNSGYKATSMVYIMVKTYLDQVYWVVRIVAIVLAFTVLCFIPAMYLRFGKRPGRYRLGRDIFVVIGVAAAGAVILFLVVRKYVSYEYTTYNAVLQLAILFMIISYLVGAVYTFHPKCTPAQRFLGMMMILVLTFTSLGSNNGVYPSMNNLFLVAPICIGGLGSFIGNGKKPEVKGFEISLMPLKMTIVGILLFLTFQASIFGYRFVFAEATGLTDFESVSTNNDILVGTRMSEERARAVDSITGYIDAHELRGTDVVLYGWIPAVSFYLELPPAFNSWADLDSYNISTMRSDMEEMTERMDREADYRPLVIMDRECLQEGHYDPTIDKKVREHEKLKLILDFMDEYQYELQYENDKFVVYR